MPRAKHRQVQKHSTATCRLLCTPGRRDEYKCTGCCPKRLLLWHKALPAQATNPHGREGVSNSANCMCAERCNSTSQAPIRESNHCFRAQAPGVLETMCLTGNNTVGMETKHCNIKWLRNPKPQNLPRNKPNHPSLSSNPTNHAATMQQHVKGACLET